MNDDLEGTAWATEGELHGPVHARAAVQAVRFNAEELRTIRGAARRAGVTTSEYIRVAVLAKVQEAELPAPLRHRAG